MYLLTKEPRCAAAGLCVLLVAIRRLSALLVLRLQRVRVLLGSQAERVEERRMLKKQNKTIIKKTKKYCAFTLRYVALDAAQSHDLMVSLWIRLETEYKHIDLFINHIEVMTNSLDIRINQFSISL